MLFKQEEAEADPEGVLQRDPAVVMDTMSQVADTHVFSLKYISNCVTVC